MPELDTTLSRVDQEINGILVSYWPTVAIYSCDVCGEAVQDYVRLIYKDKTVRCCADCSKSIIKRWSKS